MIVLKILAWMLIVLGGFVNLLIVLLGALMLRRLNESDSPVDDRAGWKF